MAAGDFQNSFALFDADGRLVDWDKGFELEYRYAAPVLRLGISYGDILRAALGTADAKRFLHDNFKTSDVDKLIQDRVKSLGQELTREYRTFSGRIIRVDQLPTERGGVRRLSRDITDERDAEEVLAKAHQQLDAADSDSQGALIEIRRNPDGSYVFPPISDALRRMLDFPLEVTGLDAMMVHTRMRVSPEDDAKLGAALEHSAQTLEICTLEYRVRDANDALRWIRQSMIPRREVDGTIIFTGYMRDVTREREAENQVELLQSIVVRSTEAIIVFETAAEDPTAITILYVNAKFEQLFGESAEALIGRPIEMLRPKDINGDGASLIAQAMLRNDGVPVEYLTGGAENKPFWVEARVETIQKFPDGRLRWVVISRDVSERRRAQDELLRAKEEAEAGSRAKTNFLANMSHELRTPLNAIIGFTDLIAHEVERTGWIPAYTDYLNDVSGSGHHLLELINTVLDLSKIEAGSLTLNIAPVDVHELVKASLALVSGMARDGGIRLSVDIPDDCPEIPGDFLKLKQVLLNILSNAVKFTPAGGAIATTTAFDDARVVIAVADTGCGISEADLSKVMQPFVQADNSLSRRFEGSGLGLSIAQELCKLHGGSLTIDSVEGQGTTVQIALPRRQIQLTQDSAH
jgi:PAS domain S-box-containing protein